MASGNPYMRFPGSRDKTWGIEDEFIFQGDGLRGLAKDIDKAAAALGHAIAPVLVEIGEEIEVNARRIASENRSKSIPGTIHGGLVGRFEYRIRAGGGDNAIAALWELGNKGSRPVSDTTFEHPVFGRWAKPGSPSRRQPKHPFLRPALAENRRSITKRMESVWDRALAPYRLRPSVFGFSSSGDVPEPTRADPGITLTAGQDAATNLYGN